MVVLMAVAAMLATIGYVLFVWPAATLVSHDQPSGDVVAVAMLIYQKAAVDWCLGPMGCADGLVPPGQLVLPPGYEAPWLSAIASNGRISTFVTGPRVATLSTVAALGGRNVGGPSAGLSSPSGLVLARNLGQTGRAAEPVGAGVPVGVPVVSQKVK